MDITTYAVLSAEPAPPRVPPITPTTGQPDRVERHVTAATASTRTLGVVPATDVAAGTPRPPTARIPAAATAARPPGPDRHSKTPT